MDFSRPRKKVRKVIEPSEYCDGTCPRCGSKDTYTRTSHVREIPDMGSTREEVTAALRAATLACSACGAMFTPEHPLYPPKFEYSLAVVEYALTRFHYHNSSSFEIARDLWVLHGVKVPEATVDSWLKFHSAEFLKAKIDSGQAGIPPNVEFATVDGTFFSTGPDVVGKKRPVDWLSVTQLASGAFLLTWPEAGKPARARSKPCRAPRRRIT
jgi:transcription elongation factor Elf1